MNAKQIKEAEGDEAIARMAAECATDEQPRPTYGRTVSGRISCGRPPQPTIKEVLNGPRR